jgi:hypothetical protein
MATLAAGLADAAAEPAAPATGLADAAALATGWLAAARGFDVAEALPVEAVDDDGAVAWPLHAASRNRKHRAAIGRKTVFMEEPSYQQLSIQATRAVKPQGKG